MSQFPKFDLAIIGLGYVGLPLGLQFAKSGCRVLELSKKIDLNKDLQNILVFL